MRKLGFVSLLLLLAVAVVALTHHVDLSVTSADARTARQLMHTENSFGRRPATFAEEVVLARQVQDRVLDAAPVNEGIPEGRPRELSDLVRAGKGLCFDRSRAIETILRLHGMETRHASIYSEKETGSALRSLATPGVESHAITEDKTRHGWMIVDSNVRWIGLTRDGRPAALARLSRDPDGPWHPSIEAPVAQIFRSPFTYVYGLYSRHGRFYPPYNPVPDVNWKELAENL